MERRRIEWAVVVASFAAVGILMGATSGRMAKTSNCRTSSAHAISLDSFTQASFPSPVVAFQFYDKERVVAALENGYLECRTLSGYLLWRVCDINATDLRFTRDGKRVTVWGNDNKVRVFFAESGTQNATMYARAPLAWSANDRYFIARSNGIPVIGDVVTGKLRPCAGVDAAHTPLSD